MTDSPSKVCPVILCGGGGTRLWPRSRASKPKPFLPLVNNLTSFEQALRRCADATQFDAPLVVTGSRHLEHVEAQLGERLETRIIVEPEPKNTAAAIALAAMRLPANAIMLACPSDHHIGNLAGFISAVQSAVELAKQGWLVSFGVEASTPETGFGYLRRGDPIGTLGFRVERFVEKPDFERAKSYLESREYSWNSGIFAFAVSDFLLELEEHRPALLTAVRESVHRGVENGRRFHPNPESFAWIEAESVDYAVMENTRRAAVVPAEMAWSDIGNWHAVHGARERDESGNAVRGPAELIDCRNVLVDSDGPKVHVIGIEDLIVVVDGDDIVVTSAAGAQKVSFLSRK